MCVCARVCVCVCVCIECVHPYFHVFLALRGKLIRNCTAFQKILGKYLYIIMVRRQVLWLHIDIGYDSFNIILETTNFIIDFF